MRLSPDMTSKDFLHMFSHLNAKPNFSSFLKGDGEKTLKSLVLNKDIVVSKPNEGRFVVQVDKPNTITVSSNFPKTVQNLKKCLS